jgi:hypothetical protein
LHLEGLEERRVLTSQLYIDFGDFFPTGGFTLTGQQLVNSVPSGGVGGPDLTPQVPGTDILRLSSMQTEMSAANVRGVNVDYNNDGAFNPADYTGLENAILSVVQRMYAPFDVNVQIAPVLNNASSAAYLTGINTTLAAGANVDGERDCWAFCTGAIDLSQGGGLVSSIVGALGIAAGNDISLTNAEDNSCMIYADALFGSTLQNNSIVAGQGLDTAFGTVIAHESGHTFGLEHAYDTQNRRATANMVANSDIMSYSFDVNQYSIFSRYPVLLDYVPNPPFNSPGAPTIYYDSLINPLLLGSKAGPTYVTGTGANDSITITKTGANTALVTVQAFSDAAHTIAIDVPGPDGIILGSEAVNPTTYTVAGSVFSYSIDTSSGIVIDGAEQNDWIQVDADLGGTVTVRGGDLTDRLTILGKGAATAVYTPDAVATGLTNLNSDKSAVQNLSGTIVIGATTITFSEFESAGSVTLSNVASLTFVTPGVVDSITVDSPSAGQNRIAGTSGALAFVPLIFSGVTGLSIDTATNDAGTGADTITIGSLIATGLQNVAVNSGAGDDVIRVNSDSLALPLAGGTFSVDGGAGNDVVAITNNVTTMSVTSNTITSSAGGTVQCSNVETASLTGGAAVNAFVVNSWVGSLVQVDGQGGNDQFTVANWSGQTSINGGTGNDKLTVLGGNASTGSYLPSAIDASGGIAVVGSNVVTFTGLETAGGVTMQDIQAMTIRTPNSGDAITLTGNVTTGSSGTTGIVGLTLVNIKSLTYDLATNDNSSGNDSLTISGSPTITGLTTLTVNTGVGNDTLAVYSDSFSLPGAGAFTYNAGAGIDTLLASSNAVLLTLNASTLTSSSGGTIQYSGVEAGVFAAGVGNNTFQVVNWQGATLNYSGSLGDDTVLLGSGDLNAVWGTTTVDLGVGSNDRVVLNDGGISANYQYAFGDGTLTSTLAGALRAFRGLTFDAGTESITLTATTGSNRVDVKTSIYTTYTINGNSPSIPNADALYVDVYGTGGRKLNYDANTGNGSWLFPGTGYPLVGARKSIFFTGFEKVPNTIAFAAASADVTSANALPLVRYVDLVTNENYSFLAYESTYHFGVRSVSADLTGDSVPEVITVPVRGRAPEIRVFSKNGTPLTQFWQLGFAANMLNGMSLAVGDVNGDGKNDIIVSQGRGASEVRVFLNQYNGIATSDWLANKPYVDFTAFAPNFIGGTTLGAGDMNNDGKAEILVGSGSGMASTINVYNPVLLPKSPVVPTSMPAVFARYAGFFPAGYLGGVASIQVGKVNADGTPDVIVSQGNGGTALVVYIDGTTGRNNVDLRLLYAFSAYGTGTRNFAATTVVARDIDGDGYLDYIFTSQGSDGASRGLVRQFKVLSTVPIENSLISSINAVSQSGYSIG